MVTSAKRNKTTPAAGSHKRRSRAEKTTQKGEKSAKRSTNDKGRDADSPLDMPARGWREIAGRAWRRSWDDNIGLVAAGTAFYGFIAIAPILVVTAILYSVFADPADFVRSAARLSLFLPQGAADAVRDQLNRVVHASAKARGIGFFGALAVAFFGARNAATALIAALNIAYDEKEKRGFAKLSLVALTIMGAGFGLALSLLILLSFIGAARDNFPALGNAGWAGIRVAIVLIALALGATGAAALYRFAPCRSKAKWKWVTPGSLFAAGAWLALTVGFSAYVSSSGNFAANYGPSAASVVLLVWLYLSAVVFLFGGELNAELERQTAQDTTEGRDKPIGQRGAEAADEVAASA